MLSIGVARLYSTVPAPYKKSSILYALRMGTNHVASVVHWEGAGGSLLYIHSTNDYLHVLYSFSILETRSRNLQPAIVTLKHNQNTGNPYVRVSNYPLLLCSAVERFNWHICNII